MVYKDQYEMIGDLMDAVARHYARTKDTEVRAVLREVLTALARQLSDLEKLRVYH
jgi:hypothetical protein